MDSNAVDTSEKETEHKCDLCGKYFMWKSQLIIHNSTSHRGEKPYSCKSCDHSFFTINELINHTRIHVFYCDICHKSFRLKDELVNHKNNHMWKPFSCDICERRFMKEAFLNLHKITKHKMKEKLFKCDICKRRFEMNRDLLLHKKGHCDVCGKLFKTSKDLDYHKSIKECFFKKCQICKRSFRNEDFLNSHKIRDHNINNCDLQGLNNFVDCSPSLEYKIKEECDFKEEIKEEVIDDDISPFVDFDKGIKEEVKEEFIV